MIKRDTGLSELQESLLIMNAIAKVVELPFRTTRAFQFYRPTGAKFL